MQAKTMDIAQYVSRRLAFDEPLGPEEAGIFRRRLEKSFSVLPPDVLALFLSQKRVVTFQVSKNPGFPVGMHTAVHGGPDERSYEVIMLREHQEWSEDCFIGGFLRELGHVVCQKPPDSEWPRTRGDRARFKEQLEYVADAVVWEWGLRHYSVSYIQATFPQHWVERIVQKVSEMVLQRGEWTM
ncbi:MAG: hypothetical protein QG577_1410 [Thermodesulfobacteriota bacterium]|nr:hypothetical protein [Thermodesulfobacteriota bacterium]